MGLKRKHDRLAFTPTQRSRKYFDELCERLTREHGLNVRVTQREAFSRMVDYAVEGEPIVKAREKNVTTVTDNRGVGKQPTYVTPKWPSGH